MPRQDDPADPERSFYAPRRESTDETDMTEGERRRAGQMGETARKKFEQQLNDEPQE